LALVSLAASCTLNRRCFCSGVMSVLLIAAVSSALTSLTGRCSLILGVNRAGFFASFLGAFVGFSRSLSIFCLNVSSGVRSMPRCLVRDAICAARLARSSILPSSGSASIVSNASENASMISGSNPRLVSWSNNTSLVIPGLRLMIPGTACAAKISRSGIPSSENFGSPRSLSILPFSSVSGVTSSGAASTSGAVTSSCAVVSVVSVCVSPWATSCLLCCEIRCTISDALLNPRPRTKLPIRLRMLMNLATTPTSRLLRSE